MKAADFQGLRGKIEDGAPLGSKTWFTAGGTADLQFKPEDAEDLLTFLKQMPKNIPVLPVGVGSNMIVRDGGVRGAVVRLGRGFNFIDVKDNTLTAGAATLDLNVARAAAEAGLSRLSFMAGIPGTIGGAVRMNAGAYGGETKDNLQAIDAVVNGVRQTLTCDQLGMSYRHTDLLEDAIVLSAVFADLGQGDPVGLEAEIVQIQAQRAETQPIKTKTGGSTFANPSVQELAKAGLDPLTKTWQLVEKVGGRGLRCGAAQVSEKHCNFLINTGGATSTDIEYLGEELRRRVYSGFGIDLRWEIKRVGDSLDSLAPSDIHEA